MKLLKSFGGWSDWIKRGKNSLQGQSGKKKVEEIKPQLFQRAELSCAGEFTAEVCLLAGKKKKTQEEFRKEEVVHVRIAILRFCLVSCVTGITPVCH